MFLLLIGDRQSALTDCRPFADLIDRGGFVVAHSEDGILAACNPEQSFVPASIAKIATALAAFNILGKDYRFQTEFFLDELNNLFIRGHGDPFLISEEVDMIASRIHALGLTEIRAVYIDDSLYRFLENDPGRGTSDNPYDVPVTATAVNFNTVSIVVDDKEHAASAEPQTPTLPIMQDMARGLAPGQYRLNICRDGCDPASRSARYTAELFSAILRARGVDVAAAYGLRPVPVEARLLFTHFNARTLKDVVYSFLQYSNNFVANQVFLACGGQLSGYPADWKRAERAVESALTQILGPDITARVKMVDGAGLSRRNRITADAMLHVLDAFRPYAHLLQEKKGARLKSGTLKDVYNYAGYLANGRSFVILLNQQRNTRNSLLTRLEAMYGSKREH